MEEVRIKVFALGDFQSIGGLEMVAGHDVVDVVDASRSESDFGEISGPDSAVGIFGLILREIGGVDVVVDVSALADDYLSLSSHSW